MSAPPSPASVFISYRHEDRAWRERIAYSLEAAGLDVLEDMGTSPGRYWESVLQTMRESATALVLVITENFLKSPMVGKELTDLRQLQGTKPFRVFPVIAEPCPWDEIEQIKENQVFPPDGTPLSKKSDSEVLADLQALAKEISEAVRESPVVNQQAEPKRGDRVAPPIIAMSFEPTSVPINGTATLKLQITNPNERAGLTGIGFADVLPDGLVVSSLPNVANSCGGAITASPGSNTFSLRGGHLEASASGTVAVSVTGKTPGAKVSSTAVTSTQGGTGNTAIATLTVVGTQQPADGLAKNVAFRLSVRKPDGLYVAMASRILPDLAVTPYHAISESGVLKDQSLRIALDFLGFAGAASATLLATDEASDLALLKLVTKARFRAPDHFIPSDGSPPTGEWQTYLYDGSNIRGTVGDLVTYQGRSYRMLHLASPADPKLGISGAPIICNGQLIGIAALSYTDGSAWYAVPISEAIIQAILPPSQHQTDWIDQATIDRFTEEVRRILQTARNLGVMRKREMVETLDLVVALYQQKGSQLALLLAEAQTNLDALFQTGDLPSPESTAHQAEEEFKGIPPISIEVRQALNVARDTANELGPSARIEAAHLLYGLLAVTHDSVVQALNQKGITPDKVKLPGTDQSKTEETERKTAPALAGYKSDDPAGTDLLDLKNEVNALASVMAAKDVEPPLSLGLFGDWGSGKSFFMRQLERRICELQEDASRADGESSYCEDIVQLTFNAWTYIDADLWANLAAEIFEGLAKAVANKRKDNSQAGRALALATASSSPAVVAETERQKQEAETLLKQTQDRLAELEQSEKTMQPKLSTREVLNEAARFAVKDEDVGKRVQEAANELGLAKGAAAVNDIQSQILEIDNIWTEIIFSLRNNKNLWVWVVASAMALAGGAAVTYAAKGHVGELVRSLLSVLTTVSAFLGAVLVGSRKVLGFVRRIRASKQNLIEKTKQAINDKIQKTRETVERTAETVKTLNQQLENMRADRQMVDFIRQRYESSDYRQHLGVIARVRTDFQHLSVLLRDVQKESENEAEQMKTRQVQKERERKKNDENAQPLFPRIDRIILYIDDLDRCPEKNVVEVLQAVHLLLAFPLFVVVVGVDPRWLLHSLRQHSTAFEPEARKTEEEPDAKEDIEWESTPMNYLEKIFQIPFTLRPLGKTGFEKFVDTFATPKEAKVPPPTSVAKAPAPQPEQKASAATASASGVQPGPSAAPSATVQAKAQETVSTPLPAAAPVSQPSTPQQPETQQTRSSQPSAAAEQNQTATSISVAEPIDRNPEHLRIEEWERTFMKTLYEFIPSPRASKRFINIYRLLRASVEDHERKDFEGDQKQGEYQCAQMLLALLTGYPEEACELLGALIETRSRGTWGDLVKEHKEKTQPQSATKKNDKQAKSSKEPVQSARDSEAPSAMSPDEQRWTELLAKLDRLGENNLYTRPCSSFSKWAPRVARYSFQSGRVLLRQRS